MRHVRSMLTLAALIFTMSAHAQSPRQAPAAPAMLQLPQQLTQATERKEDQKAQKCEQHGVKKSICTRCNPKLAAVFKAKGDWCEEHQRAESQCVICNPELAKDGVK